MQHMATQNSVIKSQLFAASCQTEMSTMKTTSGLAITHKDVLMILSISYCCYCSTSFLTHQNLFKIV